jgi:hypothetical protein
VFVCCYLHLDRWEFQEGFFTCSVCMQPVEERRKNGWKKESQTSLHYYCAAQLVSPKILFNQIDDWYTMYMYACVRVL